MEAQYNMFRMCKFTVATLMVRAIELVSAEKANVIKATAAASGIDLTIVPGYNP